MSSETEHQYDTFWEEQGLKVIDCRTCGFKHIYPIPTSDEIAKFYIEKYYRDIKPFPYEKIDEAHIEWRKKFILNYPPYQEVYRKVTDLKQTASVRMLDVGCGNTLLAKYFENQGWTGVIIEPSQDACDYLKKFGLNVFNKTVEEIDSLNLDGFSFINLEFVLEHIRDPFFVLQKLYKLVEPGGVIRICVPNDFSQGQMAYQEHYQEKLRWICLPDHINYFNFESLGKLIRKTGFKEVHRTTNFPLEFLLMAGMNYYASAEEKGKVRPFITNFENSLLKTGRGDLLKQLYENLAQLGFGRSIFMYAIKEVN